MVMTDELKVLYINSENNLRMSRVSYDDAPLFLVNVLKNEYYTDHRSEHPIVLDGNKRLDITVKRIISEVILT